MSQTAIDSGIQKRITKVRSEVERLLGCISDGADHYRVLAVTRDASIDDIREAYRRAVEHLHPLKCREIIEADGSMQWKLSQAFLRVVEAFITLSRPARRIEYDGVLNRRPTSPLPLPKMPESTRSGEIRALTGPIPVERVALGTAFGYSERGAPKASDRRRVIRFALRLPVRVTSEEGDWQEVTESWDVSRLGIRLCLSREVEPGTVLRLELPMPEYLRLHSPAESIYVINAVVRHIYGATGKRALVGAEFIPDGAGLAAQVVN